jgi:hypothetical protein
MPLLQYSTVRNTGKLAKNAVKTAQQCESQGLVAYAQQYCRQLANDMKGAYSYFSFQHYTTYYTADKCVTTEHRSKMTSICYCPT